MVLDGLLGLYGLRYDSATACGLSLYLCFYKLVGFATFGAKDICVASYSPEVASRVPRVFG